MLTFCILSSRSFDFKAWKKPSGTLHRSLKSSSSFVSIRVKRIRCHRKICHQFQQQIFAFVIFSINFAAMLMRDHRNALVDLKFIIMHFGYRQWSRRDYKMPHNFRAIRLKRTPTWIVGAKMRWKKIYGDRITRCGLSFCTCRAIRWRCLLRRCWASVQHTHTGIKCKSIRQYDGCILCE